MSHEKIAKMLVVLRKKTEDGALTWAETEDKGIFQASFPKYAVRLFEAANPFENETDFVLQICNDNGDVVEEVRDTDLTSFFEKPYVFMRDLYELARRNAMGVDAAIDEIMISLLK
ncbi:hypothetical protein ACFQZQ_06220 [Lysobacter koreensis]|uniref:Uncharacterized protein n=1 Tax=Lysobacter koreensis TaxID=266122 RepID=A0ABW2YKP5_9GAMM